MSKTKFKMPPKLKAKWLEALRSGKYKQGQQHLLQIRGTEEAYCCLGVLGRCLRKPKADLLDRQELSEVQVKPTLPDEIVERLISMNDGIDTKPKSFRQIATWIEKNL